jgi:asparagine synthase (glutamine-hydrolysing)
MCGIVGLFDGREASAIDRNTLRRMADAIAHRGPDGEGFHLAGGIGLGHRRLAIIDLSGGVQPMHSADGAVSVVFNGEIYNFQELMQELTARGHVFRTRSDTEVILHAWDAWGPACVTRLGGMFAFALWDERRQTLFIARDRLGKKPLYYATDAGRLAFASEIKALAACPWVQRRLSPAAIADYFGFGYVPDPKTIYRDIAKLPPGHTLTWRRGGTPQVAPYWDIPPPRAAGIGMEDAVAELNARLRGAVQQRLVSEVPLGAFLSGGVDSSGVVAHMAQLMDQPVKTCTIGFGEASHDERGYARILAERYGTDHVERVVSPDSLTADPLLLDRIAATYDEPFADNSALPTYRVCQIARERVTVVLSGDGGDEAFAGYRRYLWHVREDKVRRLLPNGVRAPLFGTLGRVYPQLAWAPRVFRARSTLRDLGLAAADAYFNNVAAVHPEIWDTLITPQFKAELQGYRPREVLAEHMARAPSDDPLFQAQYADAKTWLAGRMLVKVDRASMAHSLEVRSPLLDYDLFGWGMGLPAPLKLDGTSYKAVLKKALEPMVPRDLLYRPKQGFAVPVAAWLRGPLKPAMSQAIASTRLLDTGLFAADGLQRLLGDHLAGRRDHAGALWAVLMFERFLAHDAQLPHAGGDVRQRQFAKVGSITQKAS